MAGIRSREEVGSTPGRHTGWTTTRTVPDYLGALSRRTISEDQHGPGSRHMDRPPAPSQHYSFTALLPHSTAPVYHACSSIDQQPCPVTATGHRTRTRTFTS